MKKEYGRSMIEMLGVLAIIGVLSIGGLAGYTMAMNRHRANQVLDYSQRAFVSVQTIGDGSQAVADVACSDASILNEAMPTTLTSCQVERAANGASTVTVVFGEANAAADAFAQRVGVATGNTTFTMSDQGANAHKWVAGA